MTIPQRHLAAAAIAVVVALPAPRVARAEPDPRPTGVAVGLEVGEPVAATARWVGVGGLLGVGAALGTGTRSGVGLSTHVDVTVTPAVVMRASSTAVLVHVGAGLRYYRHGYDAMSVDEVPDAHLGVRGVVGLDVVLASPRLELYLEAAPGYDVDRTASCTLASGVDSVCPHAAASRAFVDVVLGARWYIGG